MYHLYPHNNKINKDISLLLPSTSQHINKFVNAYDELIDNRRKLFNIPSIDNFFYFQGEKNIRIINRCKTTHMLYHLVTKLCIEYAKNNEKNKTILIDGGGNNLGYIYLQLIKLSVKEQQQFDINRLLKNIIISRAFTLYQLANTVINELPALIQKLNCKIQIIVLDIFNTLFSVSNDKIKLESIKNAIGIGEDKIKLLEEILQNITNFSNYYFSILAFTDSSKIFNKNIFSHFNQTLEIVSTHNNKSNKNQSILYMRRMSCEKSLMFNNTIEIV